MKYSESFLLKLYRMMLKIRLCEESFVGPILKGKIKGPVHLYTGQEAIAVGVCAALDKKDYVFGTHRSHGHYLAKGGSLEGLIAEVYGKSKGCSRGRGGSMHLCDAQNGFLGAAPIVGGTISLALGAALALKIRKQKSVAVSFFGDGAAGEGVLYESLNFAGLKRLPIIFVCENNLYSTHLPIKECRASNNIFQAGRQFCVPGLRVDGNDVIKVYETANRLVRICKKENRPFLLECMTYRLRGHVGPDDNIQGSHTDIRPKKEILRWEKKDPLKRFESYLLKNKIYSQKLINSIYHGLEEEICKAHAVVEKSTLPKKDELNRYVFKK
jgi:acetoin:2,6-dichlorophenolindophenol oxidoreductase subunit alpha